jgi:hypothetical protein
LSGSKQPTSRFYIEQTKAEDDDEGLTRAERNIRAKTVETAMNPVAASLQQGSQAQQSAIFDGAIT